MSLHPEVLALIEAGPQRNYHDRECADCGGFGFTEETPQEFARRIAEEAVRIEREECAKVCEAGLYEADEDFLDKRGDEERVPYEVEQATIRSCAAAIRRRGKP